MSELLRGRVALVTGSGQGIGRAVALGFAALGAKVVTNNRKPGSTGASMVSEAEINRLSEAERARFLAGMEAVNGDAETTAQAIRAAGGEATACFADIADEAEARRLVDTAVETYGRLDILCNIAGGFGFSNLENISDELWDRVNNVKPRGYFHTMKFAVPHMKAQRYGRIVNCTSRAFMGDVIKHAEYCAANAGVVGLTRAAAIELYADGITVNAFAPFAKTRASYELEAKGQAGGPSILVGGGSGPSVEQTPGPERMVPFLAYLVSEGAAHISGSVFSLAGNSIALHQEPVVCRSITRPGEAMWTVEEVAAAAQQGLFAGYTSIAERYPG